MGGRLNTILMSYVFREMFGYVGYWGLITFIGSRIVWSGSYIWVMEYVSIICSGGLGLGCIVIGERDWGNEMCCDWC